MNRFVAGAVVLALTCAVLVPAAARASESFINTDNQAKDASVWITAYGNTGFGTRKIYGAWCVKPESKDKHGLSTYIDTVRAEVKRDPDCSARVGASLDQELSTKGGKNNGPTLVHFYSTVRGSDGRYAFQVAPQ